VRRFFLRRVFLSLITLWLLATIVFVIVSVLPSDVGRTILGPFAPHP
jgi:ABC-type dipeptide/oligopeptide/nickel transport system permease component